ncbi:carotenoid biosynthesis protein [Infirmifilum lucidum]|uniref:Carotenoid biosynthesis protein n=1 Tax=Infirmifilum lucidum TaxID=2776706 RepID=A0A7L9FHF0_9CREN|nr:carotenoid biosynthesis protein [Infirmifilum lucidum]QOJ79147.1 carotenoid biosynthesis protein [Infirmifilum lucidum]
MTSGLCELGVYRLLPSLLLVLGYALQAVTPRPLGELLLLVFLAASICAASVFWRGAMLLFLSGSLTGFIFEVIGLSTGLPFGSYTYHWAAPRILGVPVPVVVAWGTYVYTSYLSSLPLPGRRGRAVATVLYMVFLDLGLDPVMVERGLWEWTAPGSSWFGVPVSNFAGWGLVTAIAVLVYQRIVRDEPQVPRIGSLTVLAACLVVAREATAATIVPFISSFALLTTLSALVYVLGGRKSIK